MLQPAMLGYHQRRGTDHDWHVGLRSCRVQLWLAGGRDSIGRSADREGETMLTDFHVAFATVCFTLLGLWIFVVRTRHAEWRHSAVHRRRAMGSRCTSRCRCTTPPCVA